jgi:predicted lipoprotein with Yx(FWY)xxD motif
MAISTSNPRRRRVANSLCALAAVAAIAPLVAACGSSSPSNSSQSTSSPASKPASTNTAAATLATAKVPGYGVALSTGKGASVFFLQVPKGTATCTGACAKEWKAMIVTGKPTAGSGASSSLLSTVKLANGTEQVTYAGHPLYTHSGLSAASVEGTAADGGVWYLVAATGKPITKTNGSGY